mgnify:FL=1
MSQRLCFVSQRYYPGDPRLDTQVDAVLKAGYAPDVIVMRGQGERLTEVLDGVRVIRVPSLTRQRAGKIRYVVEYFSFFAPVFLLLAVLQIVRGYRLIFITNLPDTLVFTGLIPKLLGAKIMFDVRECRPEMFMDRFGGKRDGRAVRLMTRIEQAALNFVHATLTCTEHMRQALISRGADPRKISLMLNTGRPIPVDQADAAPKGSAPRSGGFKIVTHGTVIKRYGHDVLIDALALVAADLPDVHLEIIGKGQAIPDLQAQVKRLGIADRVTFAGFLPDDEMIRRIKAADLCAVTLVQNPEADLVHTHKMFEYMQLAKPIVISATSAVVEFFAPDVMRMFAPGDARALADAIRELARDSEQRRTLGVNALRTYEQYSIPKQQAIFIGLVETLIKPRSPLAPLPEGSPQ